MKGCRLIIVIFLFGNAVAQNAFLDSLKLSLTKLQHDTTRCKTLSQLALLASDEEWPKYNLQLLNFTEQRVNKKLSNREFGLYTEHLAVAYNNVGFLAKKQGDIPKALENYHKALSMHEKAGNKKEMCTALNNLGRIYGDQGERQKEIDYFLKALKFAKEINDTKGIAGAYNNIGGFYHETGDTTKALEWFNKALNIMKEIRDYKAWARALNNIGRIYEHQNNFVKAIAYYNEAMDIQKQINDKPGLTTALNCLSNVAIKQRQFNKAKEYSLQSLSLAKELGFPISIKNAAKSLKIIFKEQKNFDGALAMIELESKMNDSINSDIAKKSSIKKQFQYEFEKKSAADSVKNVEAQKVKDAQLKAQSALLKQEKTQRYALYGGLILVAGFLVFVINRFRITNKQKKIIEEQKIVVDKAFDKLHEKNKEVLDSIQYARRIQSALMPNEKYIDRVLKTHK